jgi:hypothetical protein
LEPVTLPDGEQTNLPVLPLSLDGKRPGGPVTLSKAGADARTILLDLDYNADEIEALLGAR